MSAKTFVDLVLDNGELVHIECPSKHEDELHETIRDCIRRKDVWSVRQWDGAAATYMGHHLDRVNMARVVALL